MDESLMQQRRVSEEGFRPVKLCQGGKMISGLIGHLSDGTPKGSTG
jgi:hypothetical protein